MAEPKTSPRIKPGSVVRCRIRRFLVEDVQPPMHRKVPEGGDRGVTLACLEDDAIGTPLISWLDQGRGDGEQAALSDLLILDEAHNATPASNSLHDAIDSGLTRSLRDLAPCFEHRLFLSATPHNGHSNSFTALLELLDPACFNAYPEQEPLRILIATDAARKGVNLQNHCRHLIHFDIPWNPSKLEQRNGRIDRKLRPAQPWHPRGQATRRDPLLRLEFADWSQGPAQNHPAALVDREQLALSV